MKLKKLKIKKCPECGYEVEANLKTCTNCGYPFGVTVKKMLAICGMIAAGTIAVTELVINICDLSAINTRPEYVKFTEEAFFVYEGETTEVDFNVLPSYAHDGKVLLVIDDTNIAEYNDGKIIGKNVGKTKIYWKDKPDFSRMVYVGNDEIGLPTAVDDFVVSVGSVVDRIIIRLTNNKIDEYVYANANVDLQILNEQGECVYTDSVELYEYINDIYEGFCIPILFQEIERQKSSNGQLRVHVYNDYFDLGWKEWGFPIPSLEDEINEEIDVGFEEEIDEE